ncbi:asparagine synthase-related protein [Rhodopirellula halodulae]|uniref:asparagine synthase-related protein n=1 Tax=Rhodopirellula halodulae TaxID=2894198 RepID=UPI001E28C16D|nr:asparagine synthase-related protein [Rhodopirellula sp. JC737]MCC9655908.1 asparagine synthetase B family protein [Rhodopirellula sp. JC737]
MNAPPVIERIVNLLDPNGDILLGTSREDAEAAIRSGDAEAVGKIRGQFAILQSEGKTVHMARSIGRPMRYFLAKRAAGPCLIVAERIDEIFEQLRTEGLEDQFHPSYTRMVPAHHLMKLQLTGCPDPNPTLHRFFDPKSNTLPASVEAIGTRYIETLVRVCSDWLDTIPSDAPIGVMFSGGIDSGAVLISMIHALKERGQTPQRLKAFVLSVQENAASTETDFAQASEFLSAIGMPMLLEVISVPKEQIDWRSAIEATEDYKPLDIQSATMGLALCRGIRQRYPDWKYLVDGDGGDENFKDYPIEENPELTIRSVLNNQMLYQEGWGVDAVKHSLVYSGGQSRGHVRTSAPARQLGFLGFSPMALPELIEVAEGTPFIEMTDWSHEKLYDLKGQIVGAGVEAVTGMKMPINPKRRFQHGAGGTDTFEALFPTHEMEYRQYFSDAFSTGKLSERIASK